MKGISISSEYSHLFLPLDTAVYIYSPHILSSHSLICAHPSGSMTLPYCSYQVHDTNYNGNFTCPTSNISQYWLLLPGYNILTWHTGHWAFFIIIMYHGLGPTHLLFLIFFIGYLEFISWSSSLPTFTPLTISSSFMAVS